MVLFNRSGAALAGFVLAFCAWSLGAQPLLVAKPEQVGMSAPRLAKIGEALKKEVADGSFRGARASSSTKTRSGCRRPRRR